MAQYNEDTSQVSERLAGSGLNENTRAGIETFLGTGSGETTSLQSYDGSPPDGDTTILTVGAGQSLTEDPGTPVIIMDPDAPGAQVTLMSTGETGRIFVAGGGNDNIQTTGDGDVTIETGGGEDTINTGNGDDTIIVTGFGNSTIATGAGDDVIFVTGSGLSTIATGTGNDTINLDSDQGEVTIDGGDGFDQVTLNDSRGNHGFTFQDGVLVMNSAPTQMENIQVVAFDDGISVIADNATEAAVARLYEVMFDREADQGGLEYWFADAQAGQSLNDIAQSMTSSQEFSNMYADQSNEDFLDSLYQNAFGRDADAGGKAYWLDEMSNGFTQSQVAQSFALSLEAVELMGIDGTKYVIDVSTSQ